MKQFEYKDMKIICYVALDEINKAGRLGWELVALIPCESNAYLCVFKREIENNGTA